MAEPKETTVTSQEPKFRLNIKQNVKLEKYWEFTVRGEKKEDIKKDAEEMIKMAEELCGRG